MMPASVEVVGPLWAEPGLDARGGRYPLAVEAPVIAMVDTLVPGVSTLTTLARCYTLYWALAAYAEDHQLDAATCQMMLRRAEVALALVSRDRNDERRAHGIDRVTAILDGGDPATLTPPGRSSYSPRAWGFWSQYNGPSVTLGTVRVDNGALRAGRHACPPSVQRLFGPLLEVVATRDYPVEDLAPLAGLALDQTDSPDLGPLAELFTATRAGRHVPDDWTGDDHTRRATLRILTRAAQLRPDTATWAQALRASVAYGELVDTDPVLTAQDTADRALAWRGVLLRHQSVGAWRRLWAALVQTVRDAEDSVTRTDLHDWITAALPDMTVQQFVAHCPPTQDHHGHPAPAEEHLAEHDRADPASPVARDLAILLLGGQRVAQLTGRTLAAFLGRGPRSRGQFLDPSWVAYRHHEHPDRPMTELGRAFVDDMLAQSRRVALRKLRVDDTGRMTLFTRLHERNGRYYADQPEGAGNVGLRIDQLQVLAEQVGLADPHPDRLVITPLAAGLLELPG
jgi:hypothetical protein